MSSKVVASRLKQGQCIHCGIQTHEIKTKRLGLQTKKIPLNIPGHVQHGRCLQASCLQAGSTIPNDDDKPSGSNNNNNSGRGSKINAQTVGAAAQVVSIGLGMLVGAPELGEAVAGFAGAVTADSSSSTAAADFSSMSQQQQPDVMAMLQQQQQQQTPDYMAILQQQQQQTPDYMAMLEQQQQQQPDYMAMFEQQLAASNAASQQSMQQQPDYMAMFEQQLAASNAASQQSMQQQQPDYMAMFEQQIAASNAASQQSMQQQQPDYMAMFEQQIAVSNAASQQSMQQLNELVASSQAESDRAMAQLQQAFGATTLSGGGGVPQQCCPQGHVAPLTFCPYVGTCDDCGQGLTPGVQVYLCVPCDYATCAEICR
jgi:hypothetical protein